MAKHRPTDALKWLWTAVVAAMVTAMLPAPTAFGQIRVLRQIAARAGSGGNVSLPYSTGDASGNQWVVYPGGFFQMQGNMPMYSQCGMLTINSSQPQPQGNQADIDDKTHELVMEMRAPGNMTLTRRILINPDEGYVRYIDILHNPTAQAQQVRVQSTSSINFGIQNGQVVKDGTRRDVSIGWVGLTHAGPGQVAVELFAGRGSRVPPNVIWQQNNNQVRVEMSLNVPAGKDAAVVHLYGRAMSVDSAIKMLQTFSGDRKWLSDVPSAIRHLIANAGALVSGTTGIAGGFELLRGEMFDVVELRTRGGDADDDRAADQYRGTLQETLYKLTTSFGPIDLPADHVVGLINTGQFRPRQLLITTDGQILGGTLESDSLKLLLSSGQVTQIPLRQIARMGYRMRADEPDEWTSNGPMVYLRSGERVGIQPPTDPVDMVTRCGALHLSAGCIAALLLEDEGRPVHVAQLTDGTRISGLLTASSFPFKLSGSGRAVEFAPSDISRIQFVKVAEQDPAESPPQDEAPMVTLDDADVLVGSLAGVLKLDTAFDTLSINAPEIKRLGHMDSASPLDVQVQLWDDTVISGQLQTPQVACKLLCGVELNIPIALLRDYAQPQPRPSTGAIERVRQLASDLASNDWATRDRAQSQLIAMGVSVIPVLKNLQATQSPEAQQRIGTIIEQLSKAPQN